MIVGGVVMLFTIKPPTEVNANLGNLTGAMNVTTADRDFRDYANSEIRFAFLHHIFHRKETIERGPPFEYHRKKEKKRRMIS